MRTPGFYDDIPEAEYHADRGTLSVSGAKTLLKAPALFRWEQDHPPYKDVWEFGSAVHAVVLGRGMESIYVAPFDDWKTKAAQTERKLARELLWSPLLPSEWEVAGEMAAAVRDHPTAAFLLDEGRPEVSAYATDEATGVMRRGRFDWLHPTVVVDYKTTRSAEPGHFARADVAGHGYHMQAAWYLDLARDLGHPAEAFAFVVQEKEPPYLTEVYELDDAALQRGRELNQRALERFRDCTASNDWPGYTGRTFTTLSLPRWAHYDNALEAS